jgi:hypothetical protein
MAFPWIYESNFEQGTNGEWNSETDTASQLDFPAYTELARFPWPNCIPYSGAYCMRAVLSGGTADAFVEEADIDIANTVNRFFRFHIWIDPDFTGTADDTINLFEARSASAEEVTFGLRIVASTDVINFGIGKVAPTTFGGQDIERGVWYCIELDATLQTGGTGTIDIYATREGETAATAVFATQVGSLTQIAVTNGRLGVQDHLATTTGTILFDDFIMDDARVYPEPRFPRQKIFTKTGHMFVGPGYIEAAALLTDEATNLMRLWDTDVADVNATQSFTIEFDLDNQTAYSGPMFFQKGCYVELSGTDPRGQVILVNNNNKPGVYGPLYYSPSGLKRLGVS